MTSPTEEVGTTVRSVIKVLESQPLALAMIIICFVLLGYLWYSGIENNKQRAELGRAIFKEHQETRDLLAKCIVPGKTTYTEEPLKPLGMVEEPHKPIYPDPPSSPSSGQQAQP